MGDERRGRTGAPALQAARVVTAALVLAATALLVGAFSAAAACAPQIVLDDVVYEPASATAPIVLGAEVQGAFYPPCNDTSNITDETYPVRVWRVQGLDETYLARGTEASDLFVSSGQPYVPPVLPSAGLGRILGWLLAIAFVAVLVAVVRAVMASRERRDRLP